MSVGAALRELGRFLDECADDGRVSSVELVERSDSGGAGAVTAEVELAVSTCLSPGGRGSMALDEVGVAADGTLQLALESVEPVVPIANDGVDVETVDASLTDDTVAVTLAVRVPTGSDAETDRERATGDAPTADDDAAPGAIASRDRDVPPFRDPELLAEVYESCDTFAEMTEALGMDVTAETVRRYMVDYDIHQPNSYDTGGSETDEPAPAAEAGAPVVLADGIGLPDDVTVETLIGTVKRSNTIYEIKQDIGVEREDALEMLRELNLLDLVVGRLATEAERDISREEIVDRLREASATR